jgi:hypothetical protein
MYAQSRKTGKTNNFKILGSKKMEGLKQDSQNQLRSHMTEENLSFHDN